MKFTGKRYLAKDGRTLWVGKGLGESWMTFDSDPEAIGKHKFTSPALKPRSTPEQAQKDLDKYASAKGLQEVAA